TLLHNPPLSTQQTGFAEGLDIKNSVFPRIQRRKRGGGAWGLWHANWRRRPGKAPKMPGNSGFGPLVVECGGRWGGKWGPAFQTLNSFPRKLVGIEDPAHCRELPRRRAWFPLHRGTRCARAGIEKRH